jgi:hypothetical protein
MGIIIVLKLEGHLKQDMRPIFVEVGCQQPIGQISFYGLVKAVVPKDRVRRYNALSQRKEKEKGEK